jgi:cell division protein FtsX
MNKLFASVLIAAALALSAVANQAIPFGSDRTHGSLIVPVADGWVLTAIVTRVGYVVANTSWAIITEKDPSTAYVVA